MQSVTGHCLSLLRNSTEKIDGKRVYYSQGVGERTDGPPKSLYIRGMVQ